MSLVPSPVTSLILRLTGARARVAPATWAQADQWHAIRALQQDTLYTLSGVLPVPAGCDLHAVLTAGHEALRQYETLRTTFRWEDDRLSQVVWGEGEFRVEVYETSAERDQQLAAQLAAQVAEEMEARPFAAHTQAVTGQPVESASAVDRWPVRYAVVLTGGRPAFLVVAFSHLALDSPGGIAVVAQEMSRLLAGGTPDHTPAWQPADLAAWEGSPEGRATSDRAITHLRRVLRSAPPTMYDLPTREPENRRYFGLQMESEAATCASARLARRLHISTTSVVLLAAAAVVLGQYSGRSEAVLQLMCAARNDETRRTLGAMLARAAACWFDFTGLSFDEIVLSAFEASMSANLNSDYDPTDRLAVLDAAQLAAGRHIDLSSYFNDLRIGPSPAAGDAEHDLTELMARTVLTEERLGEGVRFNLQVSPSGQIVLQCDTEYVPRRSVSQMLYGIERLLVAGATRNLAASELSTVARVSPAQRGAGWILCHDGHADLAATRAVWQEVVGTGLAQVYAESDGPPLHRLIAYTATHDDRSIAILHRQLVSRLNEHKRTDVRAPDWYVRCAAAPLSPADRNSWATVPVTEQGTGRQGQPGTRPW